ncbi:MAG: sodium ion-translocating decarboxylase subunit beta, partial [Paludibacter sp.]
MGLFAQASGDTSLIMDSLQKFWNNTAFANFEFKYLVMIVIGIAFLWLGIAKNWEPLLLVPIGFGILVGNVPFTEGYQIGIYEKGSVMNILYSGVLTGWYPPLIFLGIGAMTDFSTLIANPKLMLIGAAAQLGIFATFIGAYALGFTPQQCGAIGIIGGADGPTAIFLSSRLAPELMG